MRNFSRGGFKNQNVLASMPRKTSVTNRISDINNTQFTSRNGFSQ
jgi:hypothetical protein